jgi:hypothetical protein
VHYGDLALPVFEAEGELHHWSEARASALRHPGSRDELRGRYRVGDSASLDLSDARPIEVTVGPDDHLRVRLDEQTTLEVVEHEAS